MNNRQVPLPSRTLRRCSLLAIIALGLGSTGLAADSGGRAKTANKKLIEFGWDEPDTKFMREHQEEMERSPFDGCVFHLEARKAGASKGSFTWEAWGNRAFTEEELLPALDDLKAAEFRRFQENFLRFNTTPAKLNWFDDHAAVLSNARDRKSVV